MHNNSGGRRIEIERSEDAAEVLRAVDAYLNRTPAEQNLALAILYERAHHPEPGCYWTVLRDGQVAGVALQSPPTVPAVVTEVPPDCIEKLVCALAADRPGLLGIFSEAATAARFAGCWAERLKIPVAPVEAVRLYKLSVLQLPPASGGLVRTAIDADFSLISSWLEGFERDTGTTRWSPDTIRRRIKAGLISIWDDGEPVSLAAVAPMVAGTVRVGPVYTPPKCRGRGYAASCVASVSRSALDAGASQCVLYTQLSNPQSNAIYRRLGYEPLVEWLRYRFG